MSRRLVVLTLGMVLMAGACGEASESGSPESSSTSTGTSRPPAEVSLAGTNWLVTGLAVGGAAVDVPDGAGLLVEFDAAGTGVSGSGGCNSFSGTVEVIDFSSTRNVINGSVRISGLASTLMACAPGISDREAVFFDALSRVEIVALEEDLLTLASSDGSVGVSMAAKPQVTGTPLAGTEWRLTGIITGDAASSVLADTDPNLVIDESAGTLSGSGGCNGFGGAAVVGPESITITDLVSTKMACGKDGVMSQESLLFEVLGRAVSWKVDGDRLQITADDGRALEYQAG
jgi:heat shock protein HslJ